MSTHVPVSGIRSKRVGTLPLWSSGMFDLEPNSKIIHGAQLLVGKILRTKQLAAGRSLSWALWTRQDYFVWKLWTSTTEITPHCDQELLGSEVRVPTPKTPKKQSGVRV